MPYSTVQYQMVLSPDASPDMLPSNSFKRIHKHPNGKFVYITIGGGGITPNIALYVRDETTNSLIYSTSFPRHNASTSQYTIVFSNDGTKAYAISTNSYLYIYSVNLNDGKLMFLSSCYIGVSVSAISYSAVFHPSLDVLYIGWANATFHLTTCILDPITKLPISYSSITTTASTTAVLVHPSGKFLYALTSNTIYVYSINQTTGSLTQTSTSAASTSQAWMAMNPLGTFLYVVLNSLQGIFVLSINQTDGSLTLISKEGSPRSISSIVVHPSGDFIYCAGQSTSLCISLFRVNKTTGDLVFVNAFLIYTTNDLIISNNGDYLYSHARDLEINKFAIDQTTGKLYNNSVVATSGDQTKNVAVHPSGKFAYATNPGSNVVSCYIIDQISGEPVFSETIATGNTPFTLAIDSTGKFLYVTNFYSDTISGYSINQTTGSLTSIGTVNSGMWPFKIVFHPNNNFVYVTNAKSGTVSVYSFNNTTGVLTLVYTISTNVTPQGMAISSNGLYAYVANRYSNNISCYNINTSTGQLIWFADFATASANPLTLAASPAMGAQDYLFLGCVGGTNFVCSMIINLSNGTLSNVNQVAPLSSSGRVYDLTVHPNGSHLFIAPLDHSTNSAVLSCTINTSTGLLTVSNYETSNVTVVGYVVAPSGVACHPNGKWVYVARHFHEHIYMLKFNSSTRTLYGLWKNYHTGINGSYFYIEPTNRFAYVFHNAASNNFIDIYTFNLASGTLGLVSSKPSSSIIKAISNGTGTLLYALQDVANQIEIFSIDQTTGDLTSVGTVATDTTPQSLALNKNGTYLYVANRGSSTITCYNIWGQALLPTQTISTGTNSNPEDLAIDNTGYYLIVANSSSTTEAVKCFSVDPLGGTLSNMSTFSRTYSGTCSIAFNPTKSRFVVANRSNSAEGLTVVDLNTTTGAMSLVHSYNPSYPINQVVISPCGFYYVAASKSLNQAYWGYFNLQSGLISSFTALAGESLVSVGSARIDATGRYIFAMQYSTNLLETGRLFVYFFNKHISANGSVNSYNPRGLHGRPVAINSSGTFLYSVSNFYVDQNNNYVHVYSINQINGNLTKISSIQTGYFPTNVIIHPSQQFLYVLNYLSQTINVYQINQSNGTLSFISNINTNLNPYSIDITPSGDFLYLSNHGSHNISMYRINQATGVLTLIGNMSTFAFPRDIKISPTKNFLYVSTDNIYNKTISAYAINITTGNLTLSASTIVPGYSSANILVNNLVINNTGEYLYCAQDSSTAPITGFSLDQTTGEAKHIVTFRPSGTSVLWSINIYGNFLYVVYYGHYVYIYNINPMTGQISGPETSIANNRMIKYNVITNTFANAYTTVHPSGSFLYLHQWMPAQPIVRLVTVRLSSANIITQSQSNIFKFLSIFKPATMKKQFYNWLETISFWN